MKRQGYTLSLIILASLGFIILMMPYHVPVKFKQIEASGDSSLLDQVLLRTSVLEEKPTEDKDAIELDFVIDQGRVEQAVDNPMIMKLDRYVWEKKLKKIAPNKRSKQDSLTKVAENKGKEIWIPLHLAYWLNVEQTFNYAIFDQASQSFADKAYSLEPGDYDYKFLGFVRHEQVINILIERIAPDNAGIYQAAGDWLLLTLDVEAGEVSKVAEISRPQQNLYLEYSRPMMGIYPEYMVLSAYQEGSTNPETVSYHSIQPNYELYNYQGEKEVDLPDEGFIDQSTKHYWVHEGHVYLYESAEIPQESLPWQGQMPAMGKGILSSFNLKNKKLEKIKEFGEDYQSVCLAAGKIYLAQQISATEYQLEVFDPVTEQVVYHSRWQVESVDPTRSFVFLDLSVSEY